ncbi:MAG: SpoIID/LytB domain-containing protein, partial [Candidatus Omnitrophica bacterium]|nr:SpoIID/LytB domain-containing protein [Candidatus Omnitrophota bacterium]
LCTLAYAMGTPPPRHKPRYIRVAVVKDAPQLTLSVKGKYEVLSPHTDEVLIEGNSLHRAKVLPEYSGVQINKYSSKIYAVKIKPQRKAAIFLNRYRLRGNLELIRQKNGTLLAVNEIDIEDYLCGVLREEVSPHWPIEALKAQAVAARTFAVYQDSLIQDKDYALDNTIYSQVYGGVRQETWRTTQAVRLTSGEVLTYKGKIFPAFFHATCAGHTEDAKNLWDINISPLIGVQCPFCQKSPHYAWKAKITFFQIEQKLKKKGYKIGKVLHLSVMGRNRSGRVKEVKIKGDKKTITIEANKFRLLVGANLMRSANFKMLVKKKQIFLEGKGWGHGVGLCQWGAYSMSKKGFNYRQILEYYYPGAEIITVDR